MVTIQIMGPHIINNKNRSWAWFD